MLRVRWPVTVMATHSGTPAHSWKARVSRDLGSLRQCPRLPVEYLRSGIASGARFTMTMNATSLRNDVTRVADQPQAANGLAIVRLTIGAMFVWVFFENLGKGLYTPAGYAGLINHYIKASHAPAA